MIDRQLSRPSIARPARGGGVFAVERRTLPPRAHTPGRRTTAEVRAIGVAAALSPRPLADDVGRVLAGRSGFPRLLWGEAL